MAEVTSVPSKGPSYSYVVAGAEIKCSCGKFNRTLKMPLSHGVYLNNDQAKMNVMDCKPIENIMSFKVCTNPANPNELDIEELAEDGLGKNLGMLLGGIAESILLSPLGEASRLLLKAAGIDLKKCVPVPMKWINGKEDTLVDNYPALISTSKSKCIYGGEITIVKDGQKEKITLIGEVGLRGNY